MWSHLSVLFVSLLSVYAHINVGVYKGKYASVGGNQESLGFLSHSPLCLFIYLFVSDSAPCLPVSTSQHWDYQSVFLHFYMDVGELNLALTWTQQALYWAISPTPNVSLSVCCSHSSLHQCAFWEKKHQHFSLSDISHFQEVQILFFLNFFSGYV